MPRIETSRHVDHVAMAGSLEQTTCNDAAISALAVNRNRTLPIDCRQSVSKRIERPAFHFSDMPRLPFAFATDVKHVSRAQASLAQFLVQFLRRNLRRLQHRQASFVPRRDTARQITAQLLD